MTAITGHKCDVCGTFATERKGWLALKVHGMESAAGNDGWPDICSNRCLARLAVDRLKDMDGETLDDMPTPRPEKTPRVRRTYSAETRQAVLDLATQDGRIDVASLRDAAAIHDMPYTTAYQWAKQAGLM